MSGKPTSLYTSRRLIFLQQVVSPLNLLNCIVIIAIVIFAKPILLPLSLALLAAFLLSERVNWLTQKGLPRMLAVLIMEGLALGGVALCIVLLVSQSYEFSTQSTEISDNLNRRFSTMEESIQSSLRSLRQGVKQHMTPGVARQTILDTVNPAARVSLDAGGPGREKLLTSVFSFVQSIGSFLLTITSLLLLSAVLCFFLLLHWEDMGARILALVGSERLVVTSAIFSDVSKGVRKFLLLNLLVNLSFGLLVALILSLFDVPQFLLWGAFAAFLRFVPVLGTSLAMLPPLLLSVAIHENYSSTLGLFLLLMCAAAFIANVVEPLVYGKGIGVSSLAIILSALFWVWAWGPAGLLIASPFTIWAVILGRYIPSAEWTYVLFGERQTKHAVFQIFSKLLSPNEIDASRLFEDLLNNSNYCELADNVLFPLLTLTYDDLKRGMLSVNRCNIILTRIEDGLEELRPPQHDEKVANDSSPMPRVEILDTAERFSHLSARILELVLAEGGYQAIRVREIDSGQSVPLIVPVSELSRGRVSRRLEQLLDSTDALRKQILAFTPVSTLAPKNVLRFGQRSAVCFSTTQEMRRELARRLGVPHDASSTKAAA